MAGLLVRRGKAAVTDPPRRGEGVRAAPYGRRVAGWHRPVQGGPVQTFLPYADFRRTAEALDSPRLGKQRVETLQILRALELPEYGWGNHPAVRMWRGYTPALVCYGLTCVEVWRERGYGDSTAAQIAEFAPECPRRPGRPRAGGAAAQLAGQRGAAPVAPQQAGRQGPGLLRPALPRRSRGATWTTSGRAGRPARGGAAADRPAPVGAAAGLPHRPRALSSSSAWSASAPHPGVDVDATGRELHELRDLVGSRGRPGRPLLALSRFLQDVQVADEVAVLVQQGRALLVGEVLGDYEFAGAGRRRHPAPAAGALGPGRAPVRRGAAVGAAGRASALRGTAGPGAGGHRRPGLTDATGGDPRRG